MAPNQNGNKDGEPQQTAVDNHRFYSYGEVADKLHTCRATIGRMCKRGEIKRVIVNSRLIRIPGAELARLQGMAV
jgi:hypothetical protein